ncbi:MAG: hypothetical protein A2107_15380 [Verrucomicrobia bacterium GWF2_62_7]|nr:MAG: hypothetical protein A2107_15380 [Verrucomicrobia bacterium GWF2_62_7]
MVASLRIRIRLSFEFQSKPFPVTTMFVATISTASSELAVFDARSNKQTGERIVASNDPFW